MIPWICYRVINKNINALVIVAATISRTVTAVWFSLIVLPIAGSAVSKSLYFDKYAVAIRVVCRCICQHRLRITRHIVILA